MLKAYLKYLQKARGATYLHSPFVYTLYQDVLRASTRYYAFDRIEALRHTLKKDIRTIQVQDYGAGSKKDKGDIRPVAAIAKHSLSSARQCQVLFRLLNFLKADHLLELGSSLGISTAYLASARKDAQLISLEGCPQIAKIAQENLKALDLNNVEMIIGNIDHCLEEALAKLPKLDFAFLDANHRKEASLRYFEQCLPKVHSKTCLVLDDIHWSKEMEEAFEIIKSHPKVRLSIDLFYFALIFFDERAEQEAFTLWY